MKRLKDKLTSADLLIHPVPWHLYMDTLGDCLGAVLHQSNNVFEEQKGGKGAGEQKDWFNFKEGTYDQLPLTLAKWHLWNKEI
jgi:hypothetical protein